jgi:tripartite-type tricarboxylate transporter receptor subunit TctC
MRQVMHGVGKLMEAPMPRPSTSLLCFWTAAIALAVLTIGSPALAQSYPSRPIKLVVPFPGGGPLDFTARLVADRLSSAMKQPVVVENRGGASGTIGTGAVAKATPDGHTLLFVLETPLTVSPWLQSKLGYDPVRDFIPIATAARFSLTLAVHPTVPANSVAEFVAYAKSRGDKPLVYGSGGGRGDPGHLTMEYFRMRAGFAGVHVPFQGNAQVVMNLVGGQIQAGFLATPGVLPHVREGRLKALAISSAARAPSAAEIPTAAESGYSGFEVNFHQVMLAPAGLPEPIRAMLEHEVLHVLKAQDVQERLRGQFVEPLVVGGSETAQLLRLASERWRSVVSSANIRLD